MVTRIDYPATVPNWSDAQAKNTASVFTKISPVTGRALCDVSLSTAGDVDAAVGAAKRAFPAWSQVPAVKRGELLYALSNKLDAQRQTMAALVALETGKSVKDALGEVLAAVSLGRFMAGEGQRMYGKTTTSAVAGRTVMMARHPIGVAGLIIAANTPVANIAWKFFPALLCGNTVVLKAAEDTPLSAWYFGQLCAQVDFPVGVWHILHGNGQQAGRALVEHPDVPLLSFTGSSRVGRQIAQIAGGRMARVSLELGGKNPLVVCDDAELDRAVYWSVLSAFSNAGQRCAAASRIIVFESVYDEFKAMLLERTKRLRVGPEDTHDLGPVINERQMRAMLAAVEQAQAEGAVLLCGGKQMNESPLGDGFFVAPTLLENVAPEATISQTELFGPISCLYKARNLSHALELANQSEYGLTSSIHTCDIRRAMQFSQQMQAGVVNINGGTFGSEPHMPFGGYKQSGNGTREPGTEALEVYTEWKNIIINT